MKQHKHGLDAFSLLSDVLFENTDAPIPSFAAPPAPVTIEADSESADIVDRRPTWQPVP